MVDELKTEWHKSVWRYIRGCVASLPCSTKEEGVVSGRKIKDSVAQGCEKACQKLRCVVALQHKREGCGEWSKNKRLSGTRM